MPGEWFWSCGYGHVDPRIGTYPSVFEKIRILKSIGSKKFLNFFQKAFEIMGYWEVAEFNVRRIIDV